MFTWILTSVLLMLNLCLWIGNICNGLLLGNASIARGLTCCKKLARHEASRKSWSTKFPLGGEVNHIWPLAYLVDPFIYFHTPRHKAFYFSWLGPEFFVCCLAHRVSTVGSFAPVFQWYCSTPQGSPAVGCNTLFLSNPHLCFIIVFICDLFVSRDDPFMG